MGVSFVFKHKGYVGRNVLRRLVPLLWEGDLGSLLPAFLDDYVKDLVLCPHAPSIWIQPAAGDLHALGAAVEDLLQRDLQLVDHRGVLLLSPSPQALRRHPPPPAALPWEAVVHPTWKTKLPPKMSKRVILIHVHVLLRVVVIVERKTIGAAVTAVGAKEHVEGVGATKEGGKGGVWVSMEGVVVR